jgi:hypothetical protein
MMATSKPTSFSNFKKPSVHSNCRTTSIFALAGCHSFSYIHSNINTYWIVLSSTAVEAVTYNPTLGLDLFVMNQMVFISTLFLIRPALTGSADLFVFILIRVGSHSYTSTIDINSSTSLFNYLLKTHSCCVDCIWCIYI